MAKNEQKTSQKFIIFRLLLRFWIWILYQNTFEINQVLAWKFKFHGNSNLTQKWRWKYSWLCRQKTFQPSSKEKRKQHRKNPQSVVISVKLFSYLILCIKFFVSFSAKHVFVNWLISHHGSYDLLFTRDIDLNSFLCRWC